MTRKVIDGTAVADDKIVSARRRFALSAARRIERRYPRLRRPGKRAPRPVAGGPASADHHPEVVHGVRVAAVASERPQIDRTVSSRPGHAMADARRRIALADDDIVAADFLSPAVRPDRPDVDHAGVS